MRAKTLVGLILSTLVLGSATAWAVVPVVGVLASSQTTINNGAGNQTDPHVSGTIASYTADAAGGLTQIRYFDFAAGADTGIPNGASFDLLSDVDAGRIVFTRVSAGKQAIMLFDAATGTGLVELDPTEGSRRRGAAIGGDTVAWIDLSTGSTGEIVVYDLTTGATTTLTSNALVDRRAAVSPGGDLVVWEQCASATANCDIVKAVQDTSGWTVSNVTSTSDHESFPDTNGSIVVYGSSRATGVSGPDIYWTDLATGTEHQLELGGTQQNPNVSGNLISFESQPTGASTFDIYVHDISGNTLYQLSDTPNLDETLNGVSVTGFTGRVVWSVFEGADFNVYGSSFQVPASPTTIIATVALDPGTINLKAKGAHVTVYLELPPGHSPADVDLATVTLRAIDPVSSAPVAVAAGAPTAVGDADGDGTPDLMVKFDRATVQSWFSAGADPATFRIEGKLVDGDSFQGDASARVIDAGVEHTDEANPASVKP